MRHPTIIACRVRSGTVTIRGIVPGEYVEISFRDSGRGIPDELLPHIFDAYVTTKPAGGRGLGLGLALSRAMWVEFNAIYVMNLRPAAECAQYRSRSVEILKDSTLGADVLDARMHALWDEAKAACLASASGPKHAAAPAAAPLATERAAKAPAVALAATPAGKPSAPARPGAPSATALAAPAMPAAPAPPAAASAAPNPMPAPVPPAARAAIPEPAPGAAAAGVGAEHLVTPPERPLTPVRGSEAGSRPATTEGAGADATRRFAGAPRIRMLPMRPPIALPTVVELRLEAECGKRNPYAYQATDDDPCEKAAREKEKAAVATAPTEPAAVTGPPAGPSRAGWAAAIVGALAAVTAAAAWYRGRRRRTGALPAPVQVPLAGAAADRNSTSPAEAAQNPPAAA
jgi:hypothetical protein